MTTKPKSDLSELSPKHLQALELIRLGTLSYKQIAHAVGWSEPYLYDLIAGDTAKCGSSASLFAAEVDRIDAELMKKIKHLSKDVKQGILAKFDEYVKQYQGKKTNKQARREMCSIMHAIAKVTPNVEIGSFSYTKGLSIEDIYNEFRRLKGLGSDGRGVSPLTQRGTGALPQPEEPGNPT